MNVSTDQLKRSKVKKLEKKYQNLLKDFLWKNSIQSSLKHSRANLINNEAPGKLERLCQNKPVLIFCFISGAYISAFISVLYMPLHVICIINGTVRHYVIQK